MNLWLHEKAPEVGRWLTPTSRASLLWIVLLFLLPLVLTGCQDGDVVATGLTVTMTDSPMAMHGTFEPRELQIPAGQTVTWINKGKIHHTVTADDDSFHSRFVEPGQSYSHTFLAPGRYPYHCVLHGSEGGVGMAGVIIVVAGSSLPAASPRDRSSSADIWTVLFPSSEM